MATWHEKVTQDVVRRCMSSQHVLILIVLAGAVVTSNVRVDVVEEVCTWSVDDVESSCHTTTRISFPPQWTLPTTDAYAKLRALTVHREFLAPALHPLLFGAQEAQSPSERQKILHMPWLCDDRDEAMILTEQSVAAITEPPVANDAIDGNDSGSFEPVNCCMYPLAMNETHAAARNASCNHTASAMLRAQHAETRHVIVESQRLAAEIAEYEATIRKPSILDNSSVVFVGISFHLFQSHSADAVRDLFDRSGIRIRHAVLRNFVEANFDLERPQRMSINQLWVHSMLALHADVLVTDTRERFDSVHGFAYRESQHFNKLMLSMLDEYDVIITQVLDKFMPSTRANGQLRLLWPIEHEYLEHKSAYNAARSELFDHGYCSILLSQTGAYWSNPSVGFLWHYDAKRLRQYILQKRPLVLKERRGIDRWYFGIEKGTVFAERDAEGIDVFSTNLGMVGLDSEWTPSYNESVASKSLATMYSWMSRAKFLVALSSSWLSAGQVIAEAAMLGILVFGRAHRLMQRLLFPEFCIVRSASEAHAKISYLLAYPEVHNEILATVRDNVVKFIDREAAPTVSVLQARVLHALEGRLDHNCVLPMLRQSQLMDLQESDDEYY